jgi:zinc transport system ATP-binding protein
MSDKIIIENLSVTIGGQKIIENVNASFPVGKLTAVIGPNGAGKTTLLKCILGLMNYEGKIFIDGNDIREKKDTPVGYVPQRMDIDRGLPLQVLEFLALGSESRSIIFGMNKRRKKDLESLLTQVNGAHLSEKRICDLSGGEIQKVLLAKALSGNPEILLLDEPASGIDVAGEKLFCDILENIQETTGKTVILVSHDLSVVTRHADLVVCLDKTVKCLGTPVEIMRADNMLDLFGSHSSFYIHGSEHNGTCNHSMQVSEQKYKVTEQDKG